MKEEKSHRKEERRRQRSSSPSRRRNNRRSRSRERRRRRCSRSRSRERRLAETGVSAKKSSISDYIRSAAIEIQRKNQKEEEEKERAKREGEQENQGKSRWDSSEDENDEIIDNEKSSNKEMLGTKSYDNTQRESETIISTQNNELIHDLEQDNDLEEEDSPKKYAATSAGRDAALRKSDGQCTVDMVSPAPPPSPQKVTLKHNPIFHGCRNVECYQRLSYIDEGTYGLVFRAKDKETGEEVALKQIKFDARHTSKVGFPITALRETNILLALNHPNIVRVKEMVVGSSIDKIYMVMEYLDNDLRACMNMSKSPFSISEVKRLMLQLLGAIDHMHQNWYIHRDLKTSNLLYSNKEKKLAVCDFGLARKYGSPLQPYTFEVVTLWYRCPELLLGERKYSTPVDIWSIGCIFAELLLKKPMFMGEGEPDQISKIFKVIGAPTKEKWPGFCSLPNSNKIGTHFPTKSKLQSFFPKTSFGGGISLSDSGFDLLSGLLEMDPEKRISASEGLNHKWFKEQPLPCPVDLMPTFSKPPTTESNK